MLSTLRSSAWPVLAVLATLLVVVLAKRKRELESLAHELAQQHYQPYPGLVVPRVPTETLDGDRLVLGLPDSGRLQLLLVFRPDNKPSTQSLDAWLALDSAVGHDASVDVVGVSLVSAAETREYAVEHRLPFPVVTMAVERMQDVWHARRAPQVQLVDRRGLVRYARVGPLTESAAVDSVRSATLGELARLRVASSRDSSTPPPLS